jgi:hypothetical protein
MLITYGQQKVLVCVRIKHREREREVSQDMQNTRNRSGISAMHTRAKQSCTLQNPSANWPTVCSMCCFLLSPCCSVILSERVVIYVTCDLFVTGKAAIVRARTDSMSSHDLTCRLKAVAGHGWFVFCPCPHGLPQFLYADVMVHSI